MSATMDKKTPWHKEPMVWLLIALPISAVIGGALTIWFAATNADTLVSSDDYYKVGMAPLQHTEQDARATALGLRADLQGEAGSLRVRLTGRLDSRPHTLTLMLAHPTEVAEDIQLTLTEAADGSYQGPLPTLTPGKRRLLLQPMGGEWRLTGEWQAPFSGHLALEATPNHLPTKSNQD